MTNEQLRDLMLMVELRIKEQEFRELDNYLKDQGHLLDDLGAVGLLRATFRCRHLLFNWQELCQKIYIRLGDQARHRMRGLTDNEVFPLKR